MVYFFLPFGKYVNYFAGEIISFNNYEKRDEMLEMYIKIPPPRNPDRFLRSTPSEA